MGINEAHNQQPTDPPQAADIGFVDNAGMVGDGSSALPEFSDQGDGRQPAPGTLIVQPGMIGQYRVIRRLGAGGMGVVYEAEQLRPRRRVAIKVIRPGVISDGIRRRLELESEVLGRLSHPNIARIYEAGLADTGGGLDPFYVMELVPQAACIRDYALKHSLSIPRRLELILMVCHALDHAHQNSVLHRDIKPDNILVTPTGDLKVVDFGVARLVDQTVATASLLTIHGQVIGSLPYMSPEQAAGKLDQLDVRSDICSLGIVMYELLTGAHPYDLRDLSIPQAARVMIECTARPLRQHDRQLPDDVQTIVNKAMDKYPGNRYQSMGEMADDISRHLRGERVVARPPGFPTRARRLIVRTMARGAVRAAMAISLAAGGVAASTGMMQTRQRDDRNRLDEASRHAQAMEQKARRAAYRQAIAQAQQSIRHGDVGNARLVLEACPEDLRGWEWRSLFRAMDQSMRSIRMPKPAYGVAWSSDGKLVAASAEGGHVHVFDATSGDLKFALVGHTGLDPVYAVDFSRDGRFIATAGSDRTARLWDAATGRLVHVFTAGGNYVKAALFSPDSSRLAFAGHLPHLYIVDLTSQVVATFKPSHRNSVNVRDIAWAADGMSLFAYSPHELARIRASDGHILWVSPNEDFASTDASLIHDAHRDELICTTSDHKVVRRSARDGQATGTLLGHEAACLGVAVNPVDTRVLASAGREGKIILWDIDTSRPVHQLTGHQADVCGVAWSPDGRSLASVSGDHTLRIWRPSELIASIYPPMPTKARPRMIDVTPDGSRIIYWQYGGSPLVFDCVNGQYNLARAYTKRGNPDPGIRRHQIASTQDGNVFAGIVPAAVVVWRHDTQTQTTIGWERFPTSSDRGLTAIALDSAGASVFAGTQDGHVFRASVTDPEDQQELRLQPKSDGNIKSMVIAPDNNSLIVADQSRIWLHSLADDQTTWTTELEEMAPNGINQLAISPDGTRIAAVGHHSTLLILDITNGEILNAMPKSGSAINPVISYAVAWSPDGSRLVTADMRGMLAIWERDGHAPILTTTAHSGPVYAVHWLNDDTIVSSALNGSVHRWR